MFLSNHNVFTLYVHTEDSFRVTCECGNWERIFATQLDSLSEWNSHRVRAHYAEKFNVPEKG